MSMAVGSVTVTGLDLSGNPVRSGSGAAVALFDALVTAKAAQSPPLPAVAPTLGSTAAPYQAARPVVQSDIDSVNAGRLAYFKDLAGTCNGIAAFVTYITTNAKAHVTTQSLGLTPNPNNAATAILAPSAPVDIPIT